ncbi:PREDICTED: bromodomain testis-specific [Prunus dulcis]|uniref:PREDICTED: bromodomain testis-specific n=1 Tax=Prunus dulcis TaxID=3755 RepID=A0A5E4EP57_PRUDU|nr:PREDICTED: bromodomain testis-specific [Prunus dulcis]
MPAVFNSERKLELLAEISCSVATKDLVGSSEHDKVGPDFFGYYTRLITELLSQEEDFAPFASQSSDLSQRRSGDVSGKDVIEPSYGTSGSLFGNSIGTGLSDFKKERLKSLLRQGVNFLLSEVDEMLEPVVAISQLKSQLKRRKCLSSSKGTLSDIDARNAHAKRPKRSSSFSSTSLPALSIPTNLESSKENCAHVLTTETARLIAVPEEPKVANILLTALLFVGLCHIQKVDDHLQFLIEKDSLHVEKTLGHMEQQLEKLLDTVMASCRNAACTNSSDEIHVGLEKESNVTLWRLYYYVEAVEKARKLAK